MTNEELSIATVTHEYGHILQNILKRDYMESLGWTSADSLGFVNKTAKTDKAKYKWYVDVQKIVQDKCYNEIIEIAKKNNVNFDLNSNISDYGNTSKSEFFAEVFMNSQLSKPNELGIAMNEWLEKNGLVKESLENVARSSTMKLDLQLFAEKDIKNQDSNSLKRAIRKYQKRIEEHKSKINNPQEYIEDWDSLPAMKQEGLKRHWNKEINNFNTSIDDRIAELKERGDYNE